MCCRVKAVSICVLDLVCLCVCLLCRFPGVFQAQGQAHLPLLAFIALPACVSQDGPVPGTWPEGCVVSAEGSESSA